MKKCEKCGKEIMDDAVVCPDCEKIGEKSAPIINTDELRKRAEDIGSTIKNYDYNKLVPEAIKEKVPGKYQKFLPFGILALAIAVVIVLFSMCGSSYKKTLKYAEQIENGKFSNIEKLAPKDVFEDYLDDDMDMDKKEYIEYCEDRYDDIIDSLEDEYGDNIKIDLKIEDKKKLSDKKLDDWREYLDETYDIPEKKVKKAYKLEIKQTIKGSEDKEEIDFDLVAVKIGGNWYLLWEDGSFYYTMDY